MDAWQQALKDNFYQADSLASEGFIHSSTLPQVPGVLNRYYQGQTNLVLLHIDESKLQVPLRYELAPSVNEMFPHIFGKLNIDSVVSVQELGNNQGL
jgi:uncharacterized protein (DUF952 family)